MGVEKTIVHAKREIKMINSNLRVKKYLIKPYLT
jgi:hypothetical protein